jgi:hypothetical protein
MSSGMHDWKKAPKSEPLRCAKCGTYYASQNGAKPCPK